nr:tRNA (adenosine(37)-N6)-threonylcarbamoyltransferase complex dimerization subunit type 1 TsaB [Polymorphobacter multimanifer]
MGIGTSSPALSCALFEDGRLVAHEHRIIGRGHAEAVVPAVAALPDRGRADAIFVDIGPGSFTGIRLGVAAARALGVAWGVPVHGVSAASLVAAQAFALQPGLEAVTVLLDAGRGQLLRQTVAADFGADAVQLLAPDEVGPSAAPFAGAGVLLLVPGTEAVHVGQPDMGWLAQLPDVARQAAPAALYARPPDVVAPGPLSA